MTIPIRAPLRLPSGRAPGGDNWLLCRTFRRLAMGTYNWLTEGRPDLVPNEVAITDHNLLTLRLTHPQEVRVVRFTNRQEPSTGADWEWWFGQPGAWTGCRVQAKKLDVNGRRYVDLRKAVGDPARDQVDILIEAASGAGLPACYVFYNRAPSVSVAWPSSSCLSGQDWEWGCAVAGAHRVRSVIETRSDRVDDLGPSSLPWAQFVCCADGDDLARRVAALLAGLGEETPSARDVLPPDARHLVDDDARRGTPPDLAGVVVIQANRTQA